MQEFWHMSAPDHCAACCSQQEMSSGGAGADAAAAAHGHGSAILQALGLQLDAHLSSLEILQGATDTLTVHCTDMVLEIAKLLEAVHQHQASYAQVLTEAELLRRIISDFAQFVHATGFTAP